MNRRIFDENDDFNGADIKKRNRANAGNFGDDQPGFNESPLSNDTMIFSREDTNKRANSAYAMQKQNRQAMEQNVSRANQRRDEQRQSADIKPQGTQRPSQSNAQSPQIKKKRKLTPEQRAAIIKARKRKKRKKNLKTLAICAVVVVLCTALLSSLAVSTLNDILVLKEPKSDEEISVTIPENAGFNDVFSILHDNGLIKQKFITKLFCKFRHYDEYTKTVDGKPEKIVVKYEPGVYYFRHGLGVEAMLETIKGSLNSTRQTVSLTFPEGFTIAQIFNKIEKNNVCDAEKLYSNLDIVAKQYSFFDEIKENKKRYLNCEGYLFPDTYEFFIGESPTSILKKLFNNFDSKWTEKYKKRAKALDMTENQIVILASIIQREAKDKTQMADVSAVLHNRLKKSGEFPSLQLNSTQDYITNLNELKVFESDVYYNLYLESYNTFKAKGLPPGAICNPGVDAIKAALYPSDTTYLYFCHDKNGNIYLSNTMQEHKINVAKVQREDDE